MFMDARKIPTGTEIDTDICIIGAGAAGITIARELIHSGLRVCLLESGALKRERATQKLYEGKNVSEIYEDNGGSFEQYLEITRSRYFGGSSNCWGGWCRPYDEIDFKERPWIPYSGWPLSKSDLLPYYARAHKVLKLGPVEYDPLFWQEAIRDPDFRVMPLADGPVETLISQFSPPVRFGRDYYGDIASATNVKAILRANAIELKTGEDGHAIEYVPVATLSGNRFRVKARYFILATGGIENARLLLASNKVRARGLGNENDLVGRFFMEHASVPSGTVMLSRPGTFSPCYDAFYFYNNPKFSAHGARVAAHLGIGEIDQERYRILNSRTYVRSILRGDHSAGVESLRNLYRLLKNTHKFPQFRASDVLNVVTGIPGIASVALGRLLGSERFVAEHRLFHVVEPSPDPDSRVTLGREYDPLGIPKVVLDWRRGEIERRTIVYAQELLDRQMRQAGLGYVKKWEPTARWPSKTQWVWHHMGTTRMSSDPRRGVVDQNARVHSVPNLFVAGSSVFPTGGTDAPTLTIVALALRLADHIGLQMRERAYTVRVHDQSPVGRRPLKDEMPLAVSARPG